MNRPKFLWRGNWAVLLTWAVPLCISLSAGPSDADSPAKISVKPASLDFGSVKAGGVSSLKTLTIGNAGGADLTVSSISLSGSNVPEFAVSPAGGCPDLITPGGACILTISFKPATPFTKKSATLNISSDDPKKPKVSVKLSGQVPPPKVSVKPTKLDFGSVNVGATSADKPLTIGNTGISDLEISSLTITGSHPSDFVQEANESEFPPSTCPSTLPSGGSCQVTLKFTPHAAGDRSATLNVLSDDPKKSALAIKLSGKGAIGSAATLDPPRNVTYKLESETLTVNWAAVSGATGYRVSIGTRAGRYDATYDLGPAARMGPVDIRDVPHDTYYAAVKAYNEAAESAYSDEISIAIAPPRSALSEDQSLIVAELGNPDYMTVLFNNDPKRKQETWVYKDPGDLYLFYDGEIIDDTTVTVDPNAYSDPPAVDPAFLTPETTLSDLVELLGTGYVEVDQTVFAPIIGDADFKTYHFMNKGLYVSFLDEKLMAAVTTDIMGNSFTSTALMSTGNDPQKNNTDNIMPKPQPDWSVPRNAKVLLVVLYLTILFRWENISGDILAIAACVDAADLDEDYHKMWKCLDESSQAYHDFFSNPDKHGLPSGLRMLSGQIEAQTDPTDNPPPCTSYIYSNNWSPCAPDGTQTREVIGKLPEGCTGDPPSPPETRTCTPACISFIFGEWSPCVGGTNTRTYTKVPEGCIGEPDPADLTQTCPPCTYRYGPWSACVNGKQTREVQEAWPPECGGGLPPVLEQDCTATFYGGFDANGPFKYTGYCSNCDNNDYVCTYNVTVSGTILVVLSAIQPDGTYSGTAILNATITAPGGPSDCFY